MNIYKLSHNFLFYSDGDLRQGKMEFYHFIIKSTVEIYKCFQFSWKMYLTIVKYNQYCSSFVYS